MPVIRYFMNPKAALVLLVISTVFILWNRYAEEHDNWLTRLAQWHNRHEETVQRVGLIFMVAVALGATLFLLLIET